MSSSVIGRLTYVGGHDAVTVPEIGVARAGEPVVVPDTEAAQSAAEGLRGRPDFKLDGPSRVAETKGRDKPRRESGGDAGKE